MDNFAVQDPAFEARVRESFGRQRALATIGAKLVEISPGRVEIELPFSPDLTQQHGYVHAGITTTIADSACGYAAMTLMPAGAEVVSVEYKVNLLSPAIGEKLIARARVVRAGRSLTVCLGDVYARNDGNENMVATMLATMMTLRGRGTAGG